MGKEILREIPERACFLNPVYAIHMLLIGNISYLYEMGNNLWRRYGRGQGMPAVPWGLNVSVW